MLVGSQSFWEGIDVPGDALQCVLIDKLPFPPPNDPLVEARVKRLEAEGRNAFADYFVAEAAVSLKQGAGRLIRSETDRGLLVVCDPRMAGMNYGRRLREALPPMTRVAERGRGAGVAASLASASTRRCADAASRPTRYQNCHHALSRRPARRSRNLLFGEVLAQHALGVGVQVGQAELVVAGRHDVERLLGRRRLAEVLHRRLRPARPTPRRRRGGSSSAPRALRRPPAR